MDAPVRPLFHFPISPFHQTIHRQEHLAGRIKGGGIEGMKADTCVGIQKPKTQKKNTINYHLMRLYPKIRGPRKGDHK